MPLSLFLLLDRRWYCFSLQGSRKKKKKRLNRKERRKTKKIFRISSWGFLLLSGVEEDFLIMTVIKERTPVKKGGRKLNVISGDFHATREEEAKETLCVILNRKKIRTFL